MDTLRTILDPHFLLRNSVFISLLVGLVCPSVGVYLVLRRLIFMGVALPQISSCGIAFTFALQGWGLLAHLHQSEHSLAFFGSTLFTIPTIVLLSLMVRRGPGPGGNPFGPGGGAGWGVGACLPRHESAPP